MTWDESQFKANRKSLLRKLETDLGTRATARDFVRASYKDDYCYLWDWAGFPILQMPEDIVALQEILFRCKPDVYIETGVAWGGSIALAATILSACNPNASVLGIDKHLRPGLQARLGELGLTATIELLAADSTSAESLDWVRSRIKPDSSIMVVLDSHHTHEHVKAELDLFSPLVTPGQYLIVGDTSITELASETDRVRPWSSDRNPMTAVAEFLADHDAFETDQGLDAKLLTTFHPGGYLRRLK